MGDGRKFFVLRVHETGFDPQLMQRESDHALARMTCENEADRKTRRHFVERYCLLSDSAFCQREWRNWRHRRANFRRSVQFAAHVEEVTTCQVTCCADRVKAGWTLRYRSLRGVR